MWVQVTSGRGPEECERAVALFYEYLQRLYDKNSITCIECIEGTYRNCFKSILLKLNDDIIFDMEGSIKYVFKSPYRPSHKRKNWYIKVEIFREKEECKINTNDIIFETMRSSGNGGQNVNKVESAVRALHIKTGLSAIAREERSQFHNKKLALARLKKLLDNQQTIQELEERKEKWSSHNQIERGNEVRCYILKNVDK